MGWPRFLPPLLPWIGKGKKNPSSKTLPREQMDKLINGGGEGERGRQGAENTNQRKVHPLPLSLENPGCFSRCVSHSWGWGMLGVTPSSAPAAAGGIQAHPLAAGAGLSLQGKSQGFPAANSPIPSDT